MREAGPLPVYHHAKTAEAEAQWIVSQIRDLVEAGARYADCAVLYRAHYLSRTLEEAFLAEEVPYTLYSGVGFFDRTEIRDALAYLRMAVYRDDLAFLRIANKPKRSLGQKRMRFLRDFAAERNVSLFEALQLCAEDELFRATGARAFIDLVERFTALSQTLSLSDLLGRLLDESGYEAMLRLEGSQTRLDDLAELKQAALDYELSCGEEAGPADFLAHVALLTGQDAADSKNAVKLMTVHTAKGLEFPNVFLCGLSEGIFPSKKTNMPEAMEEERRLAFVALTRAEDRLFLSEAEGRNLDMTPRYPSRFIFDIDRDCLRFTSELDAGLVDEARAAIRLSAAALDTAAAYGDFAVGDRVRHAVMGEGTVLEIEREKGFFLIQYDSLPTPRRISFRAKLEKVL
jgi:DNA helicase-2/ATP-dependent DNA helicase PcrA